MKKFQFRLQTLLDQRQAKEDQLLVELGEIRREEALELARLCELQSKLMRAWAMGVESKKLKVESRKGLSPNFQLSTFNFQLLQLDAYVQTLRDDIKVQLLTIEAVRERVEAKRIEVTDAMKERKVIEALRDKREREYVMGQLRAEQNALDEMASLRYARGM